MSSSNFYKVNSPGVVYESFDDEVVIINLDSGNYYSVNTTGMEIWNGLISGIKADSIINKLLETYNTDKNTAKKAVHQFIDDLEENKIIVPVESRSDSPTFPSASSGTETTPGNKQQFKIPKLNTYTDMQELLLLDPIHDVDDTGWPQVKDSKSQT